MLKKLIKERFELFCRMRWLKAIDKEVDKYNYLTSKLNRQKYIIRAMMNRYNELYEGDLRVEEEKV